MSGVSGPDVPYCGGVTDAENGHQRDGIDLKAKNANDFHRKLDYYIEHSTRVGGRKRKPSPVGATTPAKTGIPATRDPAQTRAIRQWAFDQGHPISDRGRIPADIEEAYNAAH
ncbi:putative uncharacterized protein [Rhodococcus sp. AW25M09]|nr:putative uncharacterized protein [Rhodococcus sp. AW25M09]